MTDGLKILGLGHGVAQHHVTNDELCKKVDSTDEWIKSRTGICGRYLAQADETVLSLAHQASQEAIVQSGINPLKISVVIVATFSWSARMPSVASQLQSSLGLSEALLAYDLSGACTGFTMALETARALIANKAENTYALVVGAETISKYLDFEDRNTAVLFGDGAGAAIIESAHVAYASHFRNISDANAIFLAKNAQQQFVLNMDGQGVFRFAVKQVPELIETCCIQYGTEVKDVDLFICHQANARILDLVAKRLGVPRERFYQNLEHYGNTSAASIPLALYDAEKKGVLKRGMTVVLAGFGAGLSWGGMVFVW